MLTSSYMGVQVWLITSRQTVPELNSDGRYRKSTLGWYTLFMKPTEGLLYGY
jgi:hypothetical protein